MKTKHIVVLAVCGVLFLIGTGVLLSSYTIVPADQHLVVESMRGEVWTKSTPGFVLTFWGRTTYYPKYRLLQFATADQLRSGEEPEGPDIRTTFNDGGHAKVSSQLAYFTPTKSDDLVKFHQTFGTISNADNAVYGHLVSCIKSTGPLMSATEHQAARKAEFEQIVREQLIKGKFRMRRRRVVVETVPVLPGVAPGDAKVPHVTSEPMEVLAAEIVLDDNNIPTIDEESPLVGYGIQVEQYSVIGTEYDPDTVTQFTAKKQAFLLAEQARADQQRFIS